MLGGKLLGMKLQIGQLAQWRAFLEIFGRSSKDKLAWNVVSREAESHLADMWVFSPWLAVCCQGLCCEGGGWL